MKVITKQQLIEMGGLYFENILDGINEHPYENKKESENETISWMNSLAKRQDVYADFYVGRITEESLCSFKECLSKEEYEQLRLLVEVCKNKCREEFLLFLPKKEELELLVKLSYRGLLFSTFYMVEPSVTIWSNYEGEFLIFKRREF